MTESQDPYSRDELIASLEDVHREIGDYFATLSTDDLFRRPEADVWSPAENLIHLVKSVKAVAKGLNMHRWLLGLLFRKPGGAPASSRRFDGVVEMYRDRLARGARATGLYVPRPPAVDDPMAVEESRARVFSGWKKAGRDLVENLRKWDEKSLDKYRMPHPLLGNLTVREMLFFTLYHDRHHLGSVRQRLGKSGHGT